MLRQQQRGGAGALVSGEGDDLHLSPVSVGDRLPPDDTALRQGFFPASRPPAERPEEAEAAWTRPTAERDQVKALEAVKGFLPLYRSSLHPCLHASPKKFYLDLRH